MNDTARPDDVFWIDDRETLDLLGDPVRLEIIEQLSEPRSVTEIAEAMDVPRTRLYHHVRLLEDAGLIRVVETREVGALTERRYQVSAKSFRPSERFMEQSLPREQAEAMLTALFGATRADFVRSVDEGIVSFRDDKDSRRLTLARRLLSLTPEKLAALVDDIESLISSYDSDDDDPDAIPVAVLHVVYPSSRTKPS
jgi:DNA-binding transcriptional ArsR family regulator